MTLNNRFKYILIVGAILTLIVSVGLTYLDTGTDEIGFLSWNFALISSYIFLRLFYYVLFGITIVGVFFIIKTSFDSDFIDDWLLFKVREHKEIWLWMVFILFLIFCTIASTLLIRPLFVGAAEWKEMFNLGFTLVLSFEGFIVGMIIAILAKAREPVKLSNALADAVESKLIVRYPGSAVKDAFAFFEDKLRQKLNLADDKKKTAIHLIEIAYGKNGKLKHDQWNENRNLMAGLVGKYRNPISHKQVNLDKQTVTMILTMIDQFILVIDESELQSPQQDNEGGENSLSSD